MLRPRRTNPAYSLPSAAGFESAFATAGFRVSFASAMDETAELCDLVLPDRHPLEAWGDSNPRPGLYALQQPAMKPVSTFESKQTGDVLLSVAARLGNDLGFSTFFDYLQDRWAGVQDVVASGQDFGEFWRGALRAGVVTVPSRPPEVPVSLRSPDAILNFDVCRYGLSLGRTPPESL